MPVTEPLAQAQMRSTGATRAVSVDVFRGLTMLVMIFVNELAGVRGLPAWTYHMPTEVDAMSYVDMVFPAFLFVMGLSLPLAVRSRLLRGTSAASLWLHIVVRSLILMLLGLLLANADKANRALMPLHLTSDDWSLLALIGAALLIYVGPTPAGNLWRTVSKVVGALLLATMLLIFRRADEQGHVRWLDFSYWEILGIIGWTYLATCALWLPFRRWRAAPIILLITMCAFNMATAAGFIGFPATLPLYLWPWSNGAFAVLTMSGIVTAQILLTDEWGFTLSNKLGRATGFGVVLLLAGAISVPLGISKNRATPTWCLVSAGTSVLLFVLLYWICDVHGRTRWAAFVRPAGSNTLLTYLLPDFFAFGVSLAWLPRMWSYGLPGAFRAAVFTALMLLISAVLTRWRIRLRL